MQIYLVGGAVRDKLLGIPVYDRDWVVVGATPEVMRTQGFQPVGKDFPVFLHPETHEEYALARTERKSGRGYQGFAFHASPEVTLEEDLQRRDLSINAIAESRTGELIDPYGGQQDLNARLLRHVSPAFAEDPLRVLRVARFAARFHHLGFRVADETLALMQQLADSGELADLSAERVWKELERALGEKSPLIFFDTLHRCHGFSDWLPELQPLFDSSEAHETLHQRLQRAVDHALPASTRLAVLMFDIDPKCTAQLLQRLKAPRAFCDESRLLKRFAPEYLRFSALNSEAKLSLWQGLDLARRPERLQSFVAGCRAIDFSCSPDALTHLCQVIERVQPTQLIAEGFKGSVLGAELQRRRLAAIQEASA